MSAMYQPLADRLRPNSIDEVVGQRHILGEQGVLRRIIQGGNIPNLIFYGPSGTGKTTAANIVAKQSGMALYKLNATTASLSDVKEVVSQSQNLFGAKGTLLYLDEIQYFNRKQQQSLLEYIEDGRVTLIASTTDNPYFCIYNAILSRCAVFEFKPVPRAEIKRALRRGLDALNADSGRETAADEDALDFIAGVGGGDVRSALGVLENVYSVAKDRITRADAEQFTPAFVGNFDRAGDVHYDLLSCLQKSIRGSDADAAVFYLARILEGGDLLSACRRLLVIAAEDIGLANPNALLLANACFDTLMKIGWPEGRIPLAETTIYLATSPKSNSAYSAINDALALVRETGSLPVPLHLRNAPTKLMKQLGYGQEYKYAHSYEGNFVKQQFLPDELKNKRIWQPQHNPAEQKHAERMQQLWGDRYKENK